MMYGSAFGLAPVRFSPLTPLTRSGSPATRPLRRLALRLSIRLIYPPLRNSFQRRRPNSRSPVSPSMWSAQLHTRHQRSPLELNHRPVHVGVS